MPQDETQDNGGIRRVGRKDRKKSLPASEPDFSFPEEETASENDAFQLDIPADLAALFDDRDSEDVPFNPKANKPAPTLKFPATSGAAQIPAADRHLAQRPVTPTAQRRRRRKASRQNIVSLLFLIATGLLIVYFTLVWRNPYNARLNPLAPPTPFVLVTWTPMPEGAQAAAPVDAVTPEPTAAAPTSDLAPGAPPFRLVDSGVEYRANTNDRGCDWASIIGTVTGLAGEPLDGLAVQIVDIEDSSRLDVRVFSGSAAAQGAGGFELVLGGVPQAALYQVQLFSTAGAPLSDVFEISTRETCEENVAVVNFIQQRGL